MLKKLLRAGPREWFSMLEAQLWVLWAALLVTFLPRGRLVSAGEAAAAAPLPKSDDADTVDRVVTAISRVTRFGLSRPACLVRSIALQRMLVFHGVAPVEVRFGVRKREDTFESHAWVEWGGTVVGDEPRHVRSFIPIDALSLTSSTRIR